MGEMINGEWTVAALDVRHTDGVFRRRDSAYRNWITTDGSAGPSGSGGFRAESGRYHLYVSVACPWAHRTLIMRRLKGLEDMIGLSVVNWLMLDDGWTFEPGEGVIPDTVNGVSRLWELYALADPGCTTRVTVPVLWDKQRRTIVNNESSEIIRMFNSAFDRIGAKPGDYYPEPLRPEIDRLNARIYDTLNNGVYKAGFTVRQDVYEATVAALFETLDLLEQRLSRRRYLCGEGLTEADIRLFTTLVRFDLVYFGHFKCNVRALVDYPNLWAYARDLYQHDAIGPTVHFTHIKRHYYMSQRTINPSGIVPVGPERDFEQPSGRESLAAGN
jgi:glutathionyl-hydroquinone reductase